MLGHDAGAAAQNGPGQQRAENGVADTDPGGGDTELPAKLTSVADKNNCGEIGRAVGESGQPRADAPSAEDEAVDIGGVFAAVQTAVNSFAMNALYQKPALSDVSLLWKRFSLSRCQTRSNPDNRTDVIILLDVDAG